MHLLAETLDSGGRFLTGLGSVLLGVIGLWKMLRGIKGQRKKGESP